MIESKADRRPAVVVPRASLRLAEPVRVVCRCREQMLERGASEVVLLIQEEDGRLVEVPWATVLD